MKIIANKNCTGKTKELIKESLETNTPILAFTPTKIKSLKEKSQIYFGKDVSVIDVLQAKTYDGNVLIDDIDESLSDILQMALDNNRVNISGMVVNI